MARYKLENIFDLQMGKTPSRNNSEYWNTCDNKWISIGDLTQAGKYITDTKEYLSDVAVEESGIKIIPANTVVMSFKLSIGKTAITSEDMYSNEAIMAFHDKHVVDLMPEYIYYMFKYKDWDEGTNKAVMGKTLNKATLSKVEIEVCSLEKQKEIVELLDKVSTVLDGRNEELKKLDELIKARFVEMFGDPKKNNKNLVSIGSIGHLNSGGTPSRGKPEYFQGNIKWFTAGELNSLYLGDTIEHISEDGLKNSSAKLFKKGTLMIGMYDTAAFKMGILTEDSASNQACANLEPNDNYDVIWLYYVFSILKPLYLNERQGVRQQNLSLTKIKNLQFPAAPFDKQKKFADFVREVDKSKVAVQKSLDETQLLFNSLMQKYFG